MAGRVHPFALTWEVECQDGLEESVDSGLLAYTIPALIVRDQGYQSILPRSLPAADRFSLSSPITLYRGFHPFQVFVIFPIRANPWATLCKKMAERRDTQFQSNVLLTCTGEVAGLLGHHLMVQPTTLEQDYVFIVVPDSWTFLDKGVSGRASPTPPPGAATSAVGSSSSGHTPFDPGRIDVICHLYTIYTVPLPLHLADTEATSFRRRLHTACKETAPVADAPDHYPFLGDISFCRQLELTGNW
ncbi:hypothetical protein NW754_002304 [Fusarium falciforme]|nr:hypothetical protein NW754_002304 [Fusarium falciforme]